MIFASAVFLLGGTLMTASQGSLNMIYGGRAVAGLGIGASSMVVPVYISETAPPSIRGRLVGIFEIASQGGGMLGFWINYACDQTISVEGQTQWIVPLAIQLIPGLLLLLGVAWCPESPRYLAKKDNFEGAERILCKIRCLDESHAYIQHEMSEIRAQVERRSANRQSKKQQFMKLFQKGVRNRMAIGLALMFLQSFTGVSLYHLHGTIEANLSGQHHHVLRTSHLRNTWYLWNVAEALLHWILRYRKDTRHVYLHLHRCREGWSSQGPYLGSCARLHTHVVHRRLCHEG